MTNTCTHKWELDYIEKWSVFCNGDNCDAENGEHNCGSFTENHYVCWFCKAEASESELSAQELAEAS